MKTLIIQRSAIALTLLTASGILIHDTKVDHAAVAALALPAVLVTLDLEKSFKFGADHTHVERVSFAQSVSGMPRTKPREDHKKYHLTQKVTKGAHPFDGYYLAVES